MRVHKIFLIYTIHFPSFRLHLFYSKYIEFQKEWNNFDISKMYSNRKVVKYFVDCTFFDSTKKTKY